MGTMVYGKFACILHAIEFQNVHEMDPELRNEFKSFSNLGGLFHNFSNPELMGTKVYGKFACIIGQYMQK